MKEDNPLDEFKKAVKRSFDELPKHEPYPLVVSVEWETALNAELIKEKIGSIISSETSGNNKRDKIMELFAASKEEVSGLPSINNSGAIAVRILENVKPELTAQEQSFFIAGFQECIKWLSTNKSKEEVSWDEALNNSSYGSIADVINFLKENFTLIKKSKSKTVNVGGHDFKFKEVDGLDKIGLI